MLIFIKKPRMVSAKYKWRAAQICFPYFFLEENDITWINTKKNCIMLWGGVPGSGGRPLQHSPTFWITVDQIWLCKDRGALITAKEWILLWFVGHEFWRIRNSQLIDCSPVIAPEKMNFLMNPFTLKRQNYLIKFSLSALDDTILTFFPPSVLYYYNLKWEKLCSHFRLICCYICQLTSLHY